MQILRSSILALAATFISAPIFGAVGINCSTSGSVPLIVRAEGLSETVGDVFLSCTGGNSSDPAFPINFQITFGATQVTSRLLTGATTNLGGVTSSATEALLVIDETAPANAVVATPGGSVTPNGVYRGALASQGYGLGWNSIPFAPPGDGYRTFRFTNLRVNASALGVTSGDMPIEAQISVSASSTVQLSQTHLTVASASPSYTFGVVGVGASASRCNSQSFANGFQFAVQFAETSASAFRPKLGVGQDGSSMSPTAQFGSESSYVNTASLGPETGVAANGTRFLLKFNNIPAGVSISVSNSLVNGVVNSTGPVYNSLRAYFVPDAAADGSGGASPPVPLTGTSVMNCAAAGANGSAGCSGMADFSNARNNYSTNSLQVAGGTAYAVWEVTQAAISNSETATFGINYTYAANAPGLGTATVTGSYAPAYTRPTGGTAKTGSEAGGAIPRFPLNATSGTTAFSIGGCSTTSINCTASGSVPVIVRAEGLSELVGDVVLSCTGGVQGSAPIPINFQLTFGATQVTSRVLNSSPTTTEALLLVNNSDPPGASPLEPTPNDATLATSGVSPADGTAYRGVLAAAGYGLQWNGIPFAPPGAYTRTLRFTNIRVNASALGATLIPVPITAQISVSGGSTVTLNQTSLTVGSAQKSYSFNVLGAGNLMQCQGQDFKNGFQFGVQFTELFASAFKPKIGLTSNGAPVNQDRSTLSASYSFSSESGFVNTTALGAETGIASSGTRFLVSFNNIQPGVAVSVSNSLVNGVLNSTGPAYNTLRAYFVPSAGADGSGGTSPPTPLAGANVLDCSLATATDSPGCKGMADFANARNNFSTNLLPTANGAATAVWEVTQSNQSVLETATFGVNYSYTPNTTAGLPALGSAPITGSLAAAYPPPLGTTALPSNVTGSAIPRFTLNAPSGSSIILSPCVTDMLFPFIASSGSYDTGIVIANASLDPFGTPQQTGACTLWFYGTAGDAGAAPGQQVSTPVAPGQSLSFSLQNGGSNGIVGVGQFVGYLIAQCRFQYAHGYATISDPGLKNWASGYQALVLDAAAAAARGSSAAGSPSTTTRETLTN